MNIYEFRKLNYKEKLKAGVKSEIKNLKSMGCPQIRITNILKKYSGWKVYVQLTNLEKEYQDHQELFSNSDNFKLPEKYQAIENLPSYERNIVSGIGMKELKAKIKKSKILDIMKMPNISEALKNYDQLLHEQYGN